MTPLMLCSLQHDAPDAVGALLDAGADPAPRQASTGWSAATYAAVNNKAESLRLLLERGGTLDGDWKALLFAVQFRSRDTVPIVLKAGLDVNALDEDGRTALMRAARNSDAAFVPLLLEHGADATLADRDGWTALHFAATKANVPNVRALLAAGAAADRAAHDGETPRSIAAEKGRAKVITALS